MQKIIDISTKEEIKFTDKNLPILVHGKEHSGASLLSITIASMLHKQGNKLCIFTAYPMAKEEFLKQIQSPENIFYLENEKNNEEASKYQTIFIQSGNINLFIKTISNLKDIKERTLFIKNIETINTPILELISTYPFMVSGDLELNTLHKDFMDFNYNTKIFFNPIKEGTIPHLEKYQAFMKNKIEEKIIILN